jgi:hypothetical protein
VPEGITPGWEFAGDIAEYLEQYSEDYEHDEPFAKRLLSFAPGDNRDHAVAKVRRVSSHCTTPQSLCSPRIMLISRP